MSLHATEEIFQLVALRAQFFFGRNRAIWNTKTLSRPDSASSLGNGLEEQGPTLRHRTQSQ